METPNVYNDNQKNEPLNEKIIEQLVNQITEQERDFIRSRQSRNDSSVPFTIRALIERVVKSNTQSTIR